MHRKGLFAPPELFQSSAASFALLPFRFMRWNDEEVLLVNEVGEHLFVTRGVFDGLVRKSLDRTSPPYFDLKAKHFLVDDDGTAALELLSTKYRTKRDFLSGFTGLHMFVATLRCNHSCRYCQVSRVSEDRQRYDMSLETAARSVDLMFRSPSPTLKVEFQGGEPLMNFPVVRFIVERAEALNIAEQRALEFVVATNLTPLTEEMLEFFREHSVALSTSLDGPEGLHNANRPKQGMDSYQQVVEKLQLAREYLGPGRVSALMTTTERSLKYPREIAREYAARGFDAIFLRPVSPYGFAVRTGEAYLYQARQFVEFYKEALDEIVELNKAGYDLVEVFAQILLTKILTPFPAHYVDLQSPAGAGIGCVIYNFDGGVYPSDEARMLAAMGNDTLRLGDVHSNSYEEIFGGEALRALVSGSILEAMPGCSDCAFLPYCGADPVRNLATQGDIVGHRPTSAFCAQNMGIIRHLLERLRTGTDFEKDLFCGWAAGKAPNLRRRAAWS